VSIDGAKASQVGLSGHRLGHSPWTSLGVRQRGSERHRHRQGLEGWPYLLGLDPEQIKAVTFNSLNDGVGHRA
jgi:hypothetical protein